MIADQKSNHSCPTDARTCPPDSTLSQFLDGALDEDCFNRTALHLNDCGACRGRLDALPSSDPWMGRFGRQPDRQFLDEPDLSAALVESVSAPCRASDLTSILPPVERIGAYQLIRPLGRGGMGTVYLARHETLDRLCAIKLLPRRSGEQRFDREVQSLAAIDHPGVVTATDAGTHDGWRYLVMQYVDGIDLADILDSRRTLPLAVVCRIGADAASAIAAIHTAGLIHRDVKPANIMITRDGEAKILDFGLAAAASLDGDQDRLTTVGDLVGTVAYAAPEQLAGHQPSEAADWYALGSTLFRMLTGTITHPHAAKTGLTSLMMAKAKVAWEPNPFFDDRLPQEIRELVGGLLSQAPDDRPGNSDAILTTLRQHAEPDLQVVARVTSSGNSREDSIERARPFVATSADQVPPITRRWKGIAAGFLGGALTIALAGWLIELQSERGKLTVQTDQNEATVRIVATPDEGATATVPETSGKTLATAEPVAISRIVPAKLEAVYKGKTVREHLQRLRTELDIDTLVESIETVSRVAEPDDVELVQATFLPARRYGGWPFHNETLSEHFMKKSRNAYRSLPRKAVMQATVKEFAEGTDHSIAMIGYNFLRESSSVESTPNETPPRPVIDAVNRYQADRPALPASIQRGIVGFFQLSLPEQNTAEFRHDLLRWADSGAIAVKEIDSIEQWLPKMWDTPEDLEWMSDKTLLSSLDQQVSQSVREDKAAKLLQSDVWLTVRSKPAPRWLPKGCLSAADVIGAKVPVAARVYAILDYYARPSSDALVDFETLSLDQQRVAANTFVLYGVSLIESSAADGETEIYDVGAGRRPISRRPIDAASGFYASSDLWMDQLDLIRAATDLPESMDVEIRVLHGFLLEIKRLDEDPDARRRYRNSGYDRSEPGSFLICNIASRGSGGAHTVPTRSQMDGVPNAKDRAKAAKIEKVLEAYLQKHAPAALPAK